MMPEVRISSGSIEAVKLLALLLMTGDHVNTYLFNATLPYLYEFGRIAMPLFTLVLAYNLAMPGDKNGKREEKVMKRLFLWGLIACVPFLLLSSHKLTLGIFPLNILFTLLAITSIIYLLNDEKKKHKTLTLVTALALFVTTGAVVEFWWPAVAIGVLAWIYFEKPSLIRLISLLVGFGSLCVLNDNLMALLALPIFYLAQKIDIKMPRLRTAFYVYYPAHLLLLYLIRIPMSHAGYLFF